MSKLDYIVGSFIKLFFLYIVGLLLFTVSRLIMIVSFSSINEVYSTGDLPSALLMGFRVDSQVIMYGLSLSLLIILLSPLFLMFNVSKKTINGFIKWSYIFSMTIFVMVLVGNYFFYEQFKSNYNLLIFAFFNDDTAGILDVIWSSYPIIKIFIGIFVFGYIINYISSKIIYYEFNFAINKKLKVAFIFIFLFSFFGMMRGSFGMYPLGSRDMIVSDHSFINTIATNGVLSFKQALKDGASNVFNLNTSKSAHDNGFRTEEEAISEYLDVKKNSFNNKDFLLKTKHNESLEKAKYNVVFITMESMNNNFIDLDSDSMNLLGDLREEMKNLIVFRNFLPKGPRTIHSLDGLIVNNVQRAPLSQTKYSTLTLSTSNIKPFKDKGYHTIFAYGGQLGWRNVKAFYGKQYFDEVQGDIDLMKRQKGATGGTWGIYDEFLFNDIYESLMKSDNQKPYMYFVMTTSNHTPYTLPDSYKELRLELNDSIKKVMTNDEEVVRKHFLTYQYANNQLGKFIKKIRTSKLGSNTVVVITGDHTNSEMFNYDDAHFFQQMSVPLMMYVPEELKKSLKIDTDIYGSHKDIFPTIFNLVLSDAEYINSGSNLFSDHKKNYYGVSNNGYVICKEGAIRIGEKSRYYSWDNSKTMKLEKDSSKVSNLKNIEKKAKAYKAAITILLQKEIKSKMK